jgi:hypothetical protein
MECPFACRRSLLAYREKVRPGTGREAGLGHVGEGREQDAEALQANRRYPERFLSSSRKWASFSAILISSPRGTGW